MFYFPPPIVKSTQVLLKNDVNDHFVVSSYGVMFIKIELCSSIIVFDSGNFGVSTVVMIVIKVDVEQMKQQAELGIVADGIDRNVSVDVVGDFEIVEVRRLLNRFEVLEMGECIVTSPYVKLEYGIILDCRMN